jgi:hypothetical protein
MADASSTLDSPSVAVVLDRIHAAAAVEDEQARRRVLAREATLGRRLA